MTQTQPRRLHPARDSTNLMAKGKTEFSQEVFDNICERLSDGESLRAICASDDMPNKSSVFRWLACDEKLRDQYAHAREEQADAIFDEILDIADDARNDWMERNNGEDGAGYVLNGEHVQRSRLRIDSRKWMAGKLRPKKYGDKIAVDNTHDVSDPMKELMGYVAGNGARIGDS